VPWHFCSSISSNEEVMVKFLKKIVKSLLYRPSFARMGEGSVILLPRWIYNKKNIEIGEKCVIGRFAVFNAVREYAGQHYRSKISIGDNVYIGGYSQLHCMDSLTLGDGVVLSEHVYISDIAHGFDPEKGLIMEQHLESKGPVYIGENTFVGYGVSVLPGVVLGKHCIVGTRSVVTRSFPDYSMIGGSPARLIKRYCLETKKWVNAT
jgi:acetyltransferase-like isoleucine patch superfamily enzyme